MSNVVTVQGQVDALPNKTSLGHVCVLVDTEEFIVTPKGAGVDLQHHVGAHVEVTGVLTQNDEKTYIFVRTYTILDDDSWIDDEH